MHRSMSAKKHNVSVMKNSFLLIFLSFFIACATLENGGGLKQNDSVVVEKYEPKPVEIKEKKSLAEDIIVRDIYTKEEYPLNKIATQGVVFIELSATWCKACPEMKSIPAKLFDYFKGKVFFVRLYKADDVFEDNEYNDVVPEMVILSSPKELNLEHSEAMPRVVVLANKGSEIAADITGVYPILYYYGLLSEL